MGSAAERLARDALVVKLARYVRLDVDDFKRRFGMLDDEDLRTFCRHARADQAELRWLHELHAHPATRTRAPSRTRSRESHRGARGHRRSTRSRAGPDDSDGSEPPPRLALAPKPGALYTFGALALDADLWAEIR